MGHISCGAWVGGPCGAMNQRTGSDHMKGRVLHLSSVLKHRCFVKSLNTPSSLFVCKYFESLCKKSCIRTKK